ncbi:transglycosylase domain-containing protein [Streptomyces odontomachi]|uniref:transglycosylase domain-containing protein n=1 Tax=Streptomyces odontomachi TaxID=2944940 RepID=UPI002109693E|nr:transglycosylase domain-containing protein [Streptomyces sp. ODS25]
MGKMRSGDGDESPVRQAVKFLAVSVLAGAVLAGIALPAAGALGLAAKGTVQGFDDIPANLKRPPLSQRTSILDAKGDQIAAVYSRDRTIVDMKHISPYMQQSIVAIEDSRFYKHGAVDLKGILRALNQNAQNGGVAQGASTLTQQYVKNVFIEEAYDPATAKDDPTKIAEATQQSIGRKIKELKYAIQVEEELGKKQILENYLNITFFGEQAYGIEAASERYFSKHAKDLDLPESALLAGLVQSPSRYDPVNDPSEATRRRNVVLQRMADVGNVSQAQADAAKKKPLGLKVSKPDNGCITAVKGAGFFCDYVRDVFLTDPTFGKTKEARAKKWNSGGLTIRTTLDPQAQESVQNSIKKHVYATDEVATAVTLVEPGTGKIVGMGQSRPYGFKNNETQINLSVNHDMGGGAGYQPGSTFKPIVAAAALERGTPANKVYSAPYQMPYPSPVSACDGKNWVNSEGSKLSNENESEKGPMGMKEATAKSVNTYYVQLLADIGICPVTNMADKMGVRRADGKPLDQAPSIALGSQEMSPLTMASAYATFASRGMYCTPIAIESITGPGGKSLPVPKSSCQRAMSQKTADTVNTLLKGVVQDGTGQQAGLPDRASAGKTGTTDERYAAWFVGYTPNMSGAVWVGDPAHNRKMTNITIGGVPHDKVYGADVPGPIWKDAVGGALQGKPAPNFNLVHIPDTPGHGKDKGKGKDKPGHGHDTTFPPPNFIGGTSNGGTTDGGATGGTVDGGLTNGGTANGGTGGNGRPGGGGNGGWPQG